MSTSLSLSFELICLMGWLLKNDKATLNALVKQAIKNGLAQDLKDINPEDYEKVSEQLYTTILDFLMYLEEALVRNLDGVEYEKIKSKRILPGLKKINKEPVDEQALKLNMKQAKTFLPKNSIGKEDDVETENAKQRLYEHIIKSWKPSKNEMMH